MYDNILIDFPRLECETSDSPRIQRAIDATENGILCIPKGDYDISDTLYIKNRCSLDMHPAARLIARSEMDFVIEYKPRTIAKTATTNIAQPKGVRSILFWSILFIIVYHALFSWIEALRTKLKVINVVNAVNKIIVRMIMNFLPPLVRCNFSIRLSLSAFDINGIYFPCVKN